MNIKCDKKECDGRCNPNIFTMASEVLAAGELIVYPTETIYGIGGDAQLYPAICYKINTLKGAPMDKQISVAYSSIEQAAEFVDLPQKAIELAERFLPGPLTIVIDTPEGTKGIRVPDHPLVKGIIEYFGPITSTSANKHEMPPAEDIDSANMQFGSDIQLYIDCGKKQSGVGTTVVKVNDEIKILREGAIKRDDIIG